MRPMAGSLAFLLALGLPSSPAGAQRDPAPPQRTRVAIMNFTNGAMVRHAEYEPLSLGLVQMLSYELRANPTIEIIERERVQAVLDEQDLGRTGRIDDQTAARIGRILGVSHMIVGGFVVDFRNRMRLDARAVHVESARVEYAATKTGKSEDLLELVVDLAGEMNEGMKLPPMQPRNDGGRRGGANPEARQRAYLIYSNALRLSDSGDRARAIEMCEAALALDPDLAVGREELARLRSRG